MNKKQDFQAYGRITQYYAYNVFTGKKKKKKMISRINTRVLPLSLVLNLYAK